MPASEKGQLRGAKPLSYLHPHLLREEGQGDRLLNNLFLAILTMLPSKATMSLMARVMEEVDE